MIIWECRTRYTTMISRPVQRPRRPSRFCKEKNLIRVPSALPASDLHLCVTQKVPLLGAQPFCLPHLPHLRQSLRRLLFGAGASLFLFPYPWPSLYLCFFPCLCLWFCLCPCPYPFLGPYLVPYPYPFPFPCLVHASYPNLYLDSSRRRCQKEISVSFVCLHRPP